MLEQVTKDIWDKTNIKIFILNVKVDILMAVFFLTTEIA